MGLDRGGFGFCSSDKHSAIARSDEKGTADQTILVATRTARRRHHMGGWVALLHKSVKRNVYRINPDGSGGIKVHVHLSLNLRRFLVQP